MQVGNRRRVEKKSVPPGIAIAAVIALLAFVGYLAYSNLTPHIVREKAPQKSETTLWIEQKAAESNGEFARLTPEDQLKLQKVSHGKGQAMLKMLAPKK